MRPKVAILYVGGALGITRNRKTGAIDPVESLGEIQRLMPEMQKETSLHFIPIADVESPDVSPGHWTDVAKTIEHHYEQFDGFVVIHGTNTLSYTACALSFALQGLSKPIVLTGALLPINETGSDFRSNLTFAIRTALLDIAEVCVVLGTSILRGCRSKKVREAVGETFGSTRFPPLGKFTRTFELHPWRMMRRKRTLECKPVFDSTVTMLTLHPGLSETLLQSTLDAGLHGLVMRAYGPGMIPDSLIPWIRELGKRNIPIVMTSQVLDSMVDLHHYRKQLALEKLGIISGKDMTYECALVKLMWILAQTKDLQRIRTLMEKSLVGELTE